MQHPDERQVPIPLREIQSIADDKKVRDFKTDVICLDVLRPAARLVEHHADFYPTRFERLDFGQHAAHGFAGVQNVVHQQHVTPAHVQPQFLGENQFARFRAEAIAGNAHEIEPQRQVEMPDQIRQEHDRAVEQGNHHHFASAKIALDFVRHHPDAAGNLAFRDEHALDLFAPARRDVLGGTNHWRES